MATESYFERSIAFKFRKVARYVRLYGAARTYVKVRSQLHMRATADISGDIWRNDRCRNPDDEARTVGLIGCGSFAFSTIAYFLARRDRSFLRGAMDLNGSRARSLVSHYGGAYATTNPCSIIDDPNIDLVYISSNHASHAEYAVQAIMRGKNVHIEKPHVVSAHQLSELAKAMEANPAVKVFLGFNRPRSLHFRRLKSELDLENGPLMINWFVAGHAIDDDHWYFKPEEGGRILGNLCHWSDLTLELISREHQFPCRIVPTSPPGARSDFVTAIEFADGSLASITFSAKGHTFEGVREILNVHKGGVLAEIRDFKCLSITRGHTKRTRSTLYRDHGHGANILNSFEAVRDQLLNRACDREHVINTARLFLAIRDAHEVQNTRLLPKSFVVS